MNKFTVFLFSLVLVFALTGFAFAAPNGASSVTSGADTSAASGGPQSHSALAGNVTELTIDGNSTTQAWQGYYGNVSGIITLENFAGNILYNWSLASPQGEIFASNASSITWTNIDCYDLSDGGNALEAFFNIGANDVDGVNETFSNSTAHNAFSVGTTSFAADACHAIFVNDNTGAPVDDNFEEVLLGDGATPVFAALLEEDTLGFDSATHDFEMLVLEDGHAGDSSTTPYYFYVELE